MNTPGRQSGSDPAASESDAQALERYRYMLASAPPEDIERAHEEAFARLTPDQRREALQALAQHVPPGEIRGDDPASLARAATRAEIRQPGTIERAWGGGGGGAGLGMGSWFMTTLAASFIGTAIAQSFFDNDSGAAGEGEATADDDSSTESDSGDAGGDYGSGDAGSGDLGGGDVGGDFGDFGGF